MVQLRFDSRCAGYRPYYILFIVNYGIPLSFLNGMNRWVRKKTVSFKPVPPPSLTSVSFSLINSQRLKHSLIKIPET